MSCVSFFTAAQRAALQEADDERMTPAEIRAAHPTPPASEGKLRRIRLLADSPDACIRQSAALNQLCPADVLELLADDSDPSVRQCVARQPRTPEPILRRLAQDTVAGVRGWVAANPAVPASVLSQLGGDPDPAVRGVVGWARNWATSASG